MRRLLFTAIGLAVCLAAPAAQHYQSDFPPDEFRARWNGVFDRIGDQAVAAVQGVPMTNGYQLPRQHNNFYYLSGIETPGSYIVLDGRARKVTLYLPPRNAALEAAEGKVLSADDAELVKKLTGADDVLSTAMMTDNNWPVGATGGRGGGGGGDRGAPAGPRVQAIYAEFEPPEAYAQSRGELRTGDRSILNDPFDGRFPRQQQFVARLTGRAPEIRNLNPILDELRSVKSAREIALVRKASELAGLGMMEAIRSTEPGVREYQLEAAARYVFIVNGARMDAYRSITAAGNVNINNMHYYRNTDELKDGDWVLMDYAPDFRYYVSDIGRMWPVNGTYAPWQHELLQFVLDYRNAVMTRIRPGVTTTAIREEATKAMDAVFARTKFSKPEYEQAARALVSTGGGVFSHGVGLAVHDVGGYQGGPLRPGHVFSVDPQLWVRGEGLYVRYEDTIVVTSTGYENFTDFLPAELDALQKLTREKGIVQMFPALIETPERFQIKR
ncbi:MAG TPA: Xaa-Pro aminopeptidase [Vicinamibacterales bacterium]|nr:Xaa-Pro aminopeptidase [Vicinamibacterales bacterium]